MSKECLNKIKKLTVCLAMVALGMTLLSPVSQALAQTGYVQDPGLTPPLDADVESCLAESNLRFLGIPGTAPGPLVVKETDAQLLTQFRECVATRGAKLQDWWYRRALYLKNQWSMRFITAIYGGLIDSMAMISQRIAYEAANDILTGNPGNEPRFWNTNISTWLENAGLDASSKFIDRLDVVVGDWTQTQSAVVDPKTGRVIPGPRFSFCKPPDPYSLKLSLGIGEVGRIGPGACNLKKVADNFKAIGDMVSSGDALQLHRPSVQYGVSDLSVGVQTNSDYFNYMLNQRAGLAMNRQEDRGLRPVMDIVSGKIQIPTVLAENSYRALDPVSMGQAQEKEQRGAILSAYFQVGLENIPMLALQTFSNTLIVGLMHKWLDPSGGGGGLDNTPTPQQIIITADGLKNADATGEAQDLYARQEFAKALGDYLIPNFASTEDQDIVTELTTCNTPRKRLNCAMDQALGVSINVGTKEGALTVGRASGIGSQGATYSAASQALHTAWELIPENDLKNNTDPTCAQRAYCAGNLKKMRLARIIPIGWEMAANSPHNIKHSGKYITLGAVINGFYDCNSQGELDKDHPWCHLIDSNWILAAPKYQCRAKGFGEAILPEVGTRLEECGDVVSCLKSNQKGECVGGYGYCLAERPVWKFDAKECDPQFVSCRTYQSSKGQISLLRNTEDKGKCSTENVGCQWYATDRYVTSTGSPDGLWVGTVTSGQRVYLDKGAQSCSSEGCTKVYRVVPGTSTTVVQSELNLIQNGSFEQTETKDVNGTKVPVGFTGWVTEHTNKACLPLADLTKNLAASASNGSRALALSWPDDCSGPQGLGQKVAVGPGRNYMLSMRVRADQPTLNATRVEFEGLQPDGTYQKLNEFASAYGDCTWIGSGSYINFNKQAAGEWSTQTCQFVTPMGAARLSLILLATPKSQDTIAFDAVQLEEGEVETPFVDGVAQGLAETYLKIAPDQYKCTGNDAVDHPGCKRFARVCRQVDVGCQGYQEVNDTTAPEVPAILSTQDLCPAMCAGYGEYRKLASTFDLVKDPAHPLFNDPQDETTAYFIPNLSERCTLEDVGCEPFTSMEAAAGTGEKVAYYKDVRLCEKPGDLSATYYTWEGSEVNGYQLKTWSLMASTTDVAKAGSSPPKLVLRGGSLGYIKDPASCNDLTWKFGSDPDCRQFYDVGGHVYYNYYSQTVSSDAACTTYRKDDSSESDCFKTGGKPEDASKSCTYHALPSESLTCSEVAGGCRAYLGPTGRNSVNEFRDTFATGTTITFDKQQGGNTTLQYSDESVLVGDRSLKLQAPFNAPIDATIKLAISSTSSLLRVSFWAKANTPKNADGQPALIRVDGVEVGSFYPDINWARFEAGPFMAKQNPTLIEIVVPAKSGATADNIVYIDTFSLDQLNDVQFVRKNHWAIPAACDATPEGVPEPRYMVGCREYQDRNGNSVFVRNFNRLCRDTAIGCGAFIDTNDKSRPYSETKTVKGTPFPQDFNLNTYPKHGAAKMYEEQFFGDWSFTSGAYRYYYAIDDSRGRCDSSQASCRAYGKPVFRQDRLQLATTTSQVNPKDAAIYKNQKQVYSFETILLKDNWDKYLKDNGDLDLACRKDELFCDQFQSGNITEFFRDPGHQTCVWRPAKKLKKNDFYGIPSDGEYSGWFRDGTDMPCYGSYLSSGNTFLLQYSGEIDYAGWGGKCPVDQSECTELVDPNDTSDTTHPNGKSYYVINGPKLDKSSCGGTADPLSGCVLFQDKGVGTLEASSQATYAKVMDEQGASQTPLDCDKDPQNKYCVKARKCQDFTPSYNVNFVVPPGDSVGNSGNKSEFYKNWIKSLKDSQLENKVCTKDAGCKADVRITSRLGAKLTLGYINGQCPASSNDANVVLKVRMDRECARWMGCRTGETVYDPTQNKFVTQCTEMNICEQSGSRNEDIYCAKFTDRNGEDLLNYGQYINAQSYSGRQVGFGKMDYSGLVAPDHYLVADVKPRAVGYDLLKGAKLADRYRYDQRAVAEVPLNNLSISGYTDANFKISGVKLCQDARTKRVGYEQDEQCILPISEAGSLMLVAGQQTRDLSRDIEQLYKSFEAGNAAADNNILQSAIPQPECQIYPEETSPLPNAYVAEWNNGVSPPTPKKMVEGFEHASACVYKEDCSCSYRKVRYTGGVKYYALDGAAPAVGICMGGDLDGQVCVPGGYVAVGAQNKVIAHSTVTDTCKGGACMPIQDVVSVFGKYGYCLERDLTRISLASQAMAPCLTWSPMAVLGGKYDVTHRSPTAAYQPPQGRGEYYCASGANVQKLVTPSVTSYYDGGWRKFTSKDFVSPGNLEQFSYSRPDVWFNKTANDYKNTYIDGTRNDNTSELANMDQVKADEKKKPPTGSKTRTLFFACRRASLCEGQDINQLVDADPVNRLDHNDQEGLWIMTGAGTNRSYLEYFIPYRPSIEAGAGYNFYDYRFGLFKFSAQPNALGSACKWSPKWFGIDYPALSQDSKTDFSCTDYLSKVQNLSDQIYGKLKSDFTGILDRGSEKLLVDSQNVPMKLGCTLDKGGENSKGCYFKYWETDYNLNNQPSFQWVTAVSKDHPDQFDWLQRYTGYYGQECSSGSPYFGVRAIFQDVNPAENTLEADEARQGKLSGPWQFVGFWVTTCLPTQSFTDPGLLYLRLDVVKADVCKEVAQVIAPYTRESATFADRIWTQGRFILPVLGIQYTTPNEPFGSALATGNIGNNPMLMGASVPLSGDYLKAPTFVDSGVSVQNIFLPDGQNSWVPLSNLFARIYKIYRWSPDTVNAGDWACVKGDKMGYWCHVSSNKFQGLKDCGDYATCSGELDTDLINQDWRCNTLSGVNRGLHCGDMDVPARNVDPLCHNAPMRQLSDSGDSPEAILATCNVNATDPNLLSYMIHSKDYNSPGNIIATDLVIRFKAHFCGEQGKSQWVAYPTLEGNSPSLLAGMKWNDPGPLLYGTLYTSLFRSCTGQSYVTCHPVDPCGEGPGVNNLNTVVGLLYFELKYNSQNFGHEIRDIFKQAFDQANSGLGVKPSLAGLDGGDVNLIEDISNYWFQAGNQTQSLALMSDLGKWTPDKKDWFIDKMCSADAVNAGHKCQNNEDCPKRIDPCKPGEVPYIGGDKNKTLPDAEYEGAPSCGLCTAGKPTYSGRDQYRELYKDAKGNFTGYCFGFNKFSRCSANDDCRFTSFEFWGARQDVNRSNAAIGYDWDQASARLPLVYKASDKDPQVKGLEAIEVNLPRPLFDQSEQAPVPADKSIDEYQVPRKYSEPAAITALSSNPLASECLIPSFNAILDVLGRVMNERAFEYSSQDKAKLGSAMSGESSWTKFTQILAIGSANPTVIAAALVAGWFDCSDTSCKNRRSLAKDMFIQLINDYNELYARCQTAAMLYPNGYAAHFEEIANKNQSNYRRITLAPFAINPTWRAARSIGYQSDQSVGYCENVGEGDPCGGSSFASSRVRAYFLRGKLFFEHIHLLPKCANDLDSNPDFAGIKAEQCGSSRNELFTWVEGGTVDQKNPVPNDPNGLESLVEPANPDNSTNFAMTSSLGSSFLNQYPKDIGQANGFDHRLGDIAKASLLNSEFPWDTSQLFYTTLFPQLKQEGDYEGDYIDLPMNSLHLIYDIDGNPLKDAFGNIQVTWWQMNRIWTGYGFSSDLADLFGKLITAMQASTDATNAAIHAQPGDDQTKKKAAKANADISLKISQNIFEDAYKEDLRRNYFNKTGWGTTLSEDDPRLQLFPGATPAARAQKGKTLNPVFIPGHCEPPKGGTDKDSLQAKAQGVDISRPGGDKMANVSGMPFDSINDRGFEDPARVAYQGIRTIFTSAWHEPSTYYSMRSYSGQSSGDGRGDFYLGLNEYLKSVADGSGYNSDTDDKLKNDSENGWTPSFIIPGDKSGADLPFPCPAGGAGICSYRTTCRCEGGKYDGMPKSNEVACNIGLPASQNPYAKDNQGNSLYDQGASYQAQASDLCKPVTQDDDVTPTPECQAKTGVRGSPDPDLDDNLCTHRPGYIPRGDVCADGRDQCLTTYNLHDNDSVYSYARNPDNLPVPSATDVTTGLDKYKFLTSCGVNGCDLAKGRVPQKEFLTFYQPQPPLVAAPDMTKSQSSANAVPVAAMNAFTLNNLPQGLLFTGGGQSLVTMRFYAWAANNQGPIKKLAIDWGDGTVDRIDYAQMKNQKPICNTDRECELIPGLACSSEADCPPGAGACRQTGYCKKQAYTSCHQDSDCDQKTKGDTCEFRILFGNSPDACRQGYLEFGHVYKCDNLSDVPEPSCYTDTGSDARCAKEPNLSCNYCRAGESCANGLAPQGGCFNETLKHCRFTPRLMVFDNWGWCTGDCSNQNDGKTNDRVVRHPNLGCYDGSATKINSEVMSDPATSKVISDRQSVVGNNAQECSDQEPIKVLNTMMSKADPYYQRRPWIIYQGSVELQAGEQAMKGLSLQSNNP